jgi:hypothetical protein
MFRLNAFFYIINIFLMVVIVLKKNSILKCMFYIANLYEVFYSTLKIMHHAFYNK